MQKHFLGTPVFVRVGVEKGLAVSTPYQPVAPVIDAIGQLFASDKISHSQDEPLCTVGVYGVSQQSVIRAHLQAAELEAAVPIVDTMSSTIATTAKGAKK